MSDKKSINSLPSTNPAVSIIIPMYNAQDYISECLDSLLAQTFQNFEVIIADDCSTDSSCEIIEKYMPKFDGRLKLTHTETNSGGGGHVPRNIGLMLARGDYVYFIDADDMVLGNALETMYKAAIFYNADVVYTSSYYSLKTSNDVYLVKDGLSKKEYNLALAKVYMTAAYKLGKVFAPAVLTEADVKDKDDRAFYETAKYCDVPLITGNLKHFPAEPLIMSPADFCALYLSY